MVRPFLFKRQCESGDGRRETANPDFIGQAVKREAVNVFAFGFNLWAFGCICIPLAH
jgi:hypothetical protein